MVIASEKADSCDEAGAAVKMERREVNCQRNDKNLNVRTGEQILEIISILGIIRIMLRCGYRSTIRSKSLRLREPFHDAILLLPSIESLYTKDELFKMPGLAASRRVGWCISINACILAHTACTRLFYSHGWKH
jgi:hypothetical protein